MFYPIKGELDLTNQHVINFAKKHQSMYIGKITKGMTRVFTYMMATPKIINPITVLLTPQTTIQKIHPGGARLMAAYTRGFKTLNCIALSTSPINIDKLEIIKHCSTDFEDLQISWSAWNYDWFSITDSGQKNYTGPEGADYWVNETSSWYNKKIGKKYGTINWYHNGNFLQTVKTPKNKKQTNIDFTTDQGFFNSLMYIATGNTYFDHEFILK